MYTLGKTRHLKKNSILWAIHCPEVPPMSSTRVFILLLLTAIAHGNEFAIDSCKSPIMAFTPPNPAAPRNLDEARADVVAFYENGSYDREMDAAHEQGARIPLLPFLYFLIYLSSHSFINPCNIGPARMFFAAITPPLNATVVFDIDETSLSNYEAIKEQDFG